MAVDLLEQVLPVSGAAHHLEEIPGASMRNSERHRAWQRQNRLKRKAAGICVDCANPGRPVIQGSVLCDLCKESRHKNDIARTLRLSRRDFAEWCAKRHLGKREAA